MEEKIRQLPDRALDIAAFCVFSVFAVCPLLNYLEVVLIGTTVIREYLWEPWNNFVLYFGIAFGLLYWLKAYLRNAAPKLKRHPVMLLFLAFVLWMVLATCINGFNFTSMNGNGYRREGLFSYFSYLVYFLVAALWREKKLKAAWLWVFAGTATVIGLCIIGDAFIFAGRLRIHEKASVFENRNYFGYYFSMSVLVCALGSVFAEKRWTRILWLLLHCIEAEAILLVDTQGALVGYALGLLLMIVVCLLTKRCPLWRIVLPFAAVAIVVLLNKAIPATKSADQIMQKNLQSSAQQLQAVADGLKNAPDSLGSRRLGLWRWTIARIRERPWVGYGSDALVSTMREAIQASRCHCEYMHYALNYGIPAAVLYVCGVFAVYLRGLRLRRTLTAEQVIGLCAAFGYMVSATFGNSMWYTAPFAFILLGMGYGKRKGTN